MSSTGREKKSNSSTSLISKRTQVNPDDAVKSFLKVITGPGGVIDVSTLKRIGGGGTHDIFQSDKYPGWLLKIMKHTAGRDEDELARNLQAHHEQCEKLYRIFSPSRCIVERHSIQSIKNCTPDGEIERFAVSVVPYDSCFESKEKFGFNVEPIEREPLSVKERRYLYQRENEELLDRKGKPSAYVMRNHDQLDRNFAEISHLLKDDSFKEAMRDFLIKYREFYKSSGLFLDTVGLNNALFYKSETGWQFKLGSVIKHESCILVKEMLEKIKTNPAIINESDFNFTSIYLMLANIRTLNFCAEKVGVKKVIDDIDIDKNTIDALVKMLEESGPFVFAHAQRGQFVEALELFNKYVANEKQHDTRLRDMMGTYYWDHLKAGGEPNSREEVESYLEMLRDPRNDFPPFRRKDVEKAVVGLSNKLQSMESTNKEIIYKTPPKKSFEIDPREKRKGESDKEYVARLVRQATRSTPRF